MKKSIFAATILLVSSAIFYSCDKKEAALSPSNSSTTGKHLISGLNIELVYRMGTTMEVDGYLFECIAGGPLCSVTIQPGPTPPQLASDEGLATIYVNQNGNVVISMQKATMNSSLQDSYFNSSANIFTMPGYLKLNQSICTALSLTYPYIIQPGQYSYAETSTHRIITF